MIRKKVRQIFFHLLTWLVITSQVITSLAYADSKPLNKVQDNLAPPSIFQASSPTEGSEEFRNSILSDIKLLAVAFSIGAHFLLDNATKPDLAKATLQHTIRDEFRNNLSFLKGIDLENARREENIIYIPYRRDGVDYEVRICSKERLKDLDKAGSHWAISGNWAIQVVEKNIVRASISGSSTSGVEVVNASINPDVKALIFDWDGTIADSSKTWIEIWNNLYYYIITGKLPTTKLQRFKELTRFFSESGPRNIKENEEELIKIAKANGLNVSDELLESLDSVLIEHAYSKLASHPKIFPSAKETLQHANTIGIPIYIVSHSGQKILEDSIKNAGLGGLIPKENIFSTIDSHYKTKADAIRNIMGREGLSKHQGNQIAMIGDGIPDIKAARAVGAIAVGIAKDEDTRSKMKEEKVDLLAHAVCVEILDYLKISTKGPPAIGRKSSSGIEGWQEAEDRISRALPIAMKIVEFEGENMGKIIEQIYSGQVDKLLPHNRWPQEGKDAVRGTTNFIIGGSVGVEEPMGGIIRETAQKYLAKNVPGIKFNLLTIGATSAEGGLLGAFLFISQDLIESEIAKKKKEGSFREDQRYGVLSADVGGTKTSVGIIELDGKRKRTLEPADIKMMEEVATPNRQGKDVFYDRIADVLKVVKAKAEGRGIKVLDIASIGCPGAFIKVGDKEGVIAEGTGLDIGSDYAGTIPSEELSKRTGLKVLAMNDGIAQFRYGVIHNLTRPEAMAILLNKKVAFLGPGTGLGGGYGFVSPKGEFTLYPFANVFDMVMKGYPEGIVLDVTVDGESLRVKVPVTGQTVARDILSGRSIRYIATAIDRALLEEGKEPVFLPLTEGYESLTKGEKLSLVAHDNVASPVTARLINLEVFDKAGQSVELPSGHRIIITKPDEFALRSSKEIADEMRRLQIERPDRDVVMVFATGNTMVGFLDEISKEKGIDWSRVQAFHLDEYRGLSKTHPASFAYFLNKHIFTKVPIPEEKIHYISDYREKYGAAFHAKYIAALKARDGVNIMVLGSGIRGHIAFNEAGSAFISRMREVELAQDTIEANRKDYPGIVDNPYADTMGIADILEAEKVFVLIEGSRKAPIVPRILFGEITKNVPATAVRTRPDVTWILDTDAAKNIQDKHLVLARAFLVTSVDQVPSEGETPYILVCLTGDKEQSEIFLTALDRGNIRGLVIVKGNKVCHLADSAREVNIPCVVGIEDVAVLMDNPEIILDGNKGTIEIVSKIETAKRGQRRSSSGSDAEPAERDFVAGAGKVIEIGFSFGAPWKLNVGDNRRISRTEKARKPKGSPAECLRTIYYSPRLKDKTDISVERDLLPERAPYKRTAVYKEVQMLKALGILVEGTRPHTYQLRREIRNLSPSEFKKFLKELFVTVPEINQYEISKDKIPAVKVQVTIILNSAREKGAKKQVNVVADPHSIHAKTLERISIARQRAQKATKKAVLKTLGKIFESVEELLADGSDEVSIATIKTEKGEIKYAVARNETDLKKKLSENYDGYIVITVKGSFFDKDGYVKFDLPKNEELFTKIFLGREERFRYGYVRYAVEHIIEIILNLALLDLNLEKELIFSSDYKSKLKDFLRVKHHLFVALLSPAGVYDYIKDIIEDYGSITAYVESKDVSPLVHETTPDAVFERINKSELKISEKFQIYIAILNYYTCKIKGELIEIKDRFYGFWAGNVRPDINLDNIMAEDTSAALFTIFVHGKNSDFRTEPLVKIEVSESKVVGYGSEHGVERARDFNCKLRDRQKVFADFGHFIRGTILYSPYLPIGFIRLDPPIDQDKFVSVCVNKEILSSKDKSKYNQLLTTQIIEIARLLIANGTHPDKELILLNAIKTAFEEAGIALPDKVSLGEFVTLAKRASKGKPIKIEQPKAREVALSQFGFTEKAVKRKVTVVDPLGIHAKTAVGIVKLIENFNDVRIAIRKDSEVADAKIGINILRLGVGQNEIVEVIAEGPKAQQALEDLAKFLESEIIDEGDVIKGRPANVGKIRSQVLVVASLDKLPTERQGSYILACPSGDRSYSEIFLTALHRDNMVGLVIGEGGVASHLASLAREAHIPCVAGIGDVNILKDNPWVILDGDKGTIKIVSQFKGSIAEALKTIYYSSRLKDKTDISVERDLLPERAPYKRTAVYKEVQMLKALGILVEGTRPHTYQLRSEIRNLSPPGIEEILAIPELLHYEIPPEKIAEIKTKKLGFHPIPILVDYLYSGGGGFAACSTPKEILERMQKKALEMGQRLSGYVVGNITPTTDDGGHSRVVMNLIWRVFKVHIPAMGDVGAILSWRTAHSRNWFTRMRDKDFKPEDYEAIMDLLYQNKKRLKAPEGASLVDVIKARISEIEDDENLIRPNHWNAFKEELLKLAGVIDEKFVKTGKMKIRGSSIQNLLILGHLVAQGMFKHRTFIPPGRFREIHKILGISNSIADVVSYDDVILVAKFKEVRDENDKLIGGGSVVLGQDDLSHYNIVPIEEDGREMREPTPIEEVYLMRPARDEFNRVIGYEPFISGQNPAQGWKTALAMINGAKRMIYTGAGGIVCSILTNLLVGDIAKAISERKDIPRVFILTVNTEAESYGLSLRDIIELYEKSILNMTGQKIKFEDLFDYIIIPEIPQNVVMAHLEGIKKDIRYFLRDDEEVMARLENAATIEEVARLIRDKRCLSTETIEGLEVGDPRLDKILPAYPVKISEDDRAFVKGKGIKIRPLSDETDFLIWEGKIVYHPVSLVGLLIEIERDFILHKYSNDERFISNYNVLRGLYNNDEGRLFEDISIEANINNLSLKDIVTGLPLGKYEELYEKPILHLSFGGGGWHSCSLVRAFVELGASMEEKPNAFFTGHLTPTTDSGGYGRILSDETRRALGLYIPSFGDFAGIASWLAGRWTDGPFADITREGAKMELLYKNRFTGERLEPLVIDSIKNIQTKIDRGEYTRPKDWILFIANILNIVRSLDTQLVSTGKISLKNASFQNLISLGAALEAGINVLRTEGGEIKEAEPDKSRNFAFRLLELLGIQDATLSVQSLDPLSLVAMLEGAVIKIGNDAVVIGEIGNKMVLTPVKKDEFDNFIPTPLAGESSTTLTADGIDVTLGGVSVNIRRSNRAADVILSIGSQELNLKENKEAETVVILDKKEYVINKKGMWEQIPVGNVALEVMSRRIEEQFFVAMEPHISRIRKVSLNEQVPLKDDKGDYIITDLGWTTYEASDNLAHIKPTSYARNMIPLAQKTIRLDASSPLTTQLAPLLNRGLVEEIKKRNDIARIYIVPPIQDRVISGLSLKEIIETMERSMQDELDDKSITLGDLFSHIIIPRVPSEIIERYKESIKEEARDKNRLNEEGLKKLEKASTIGQMNALFQDDDNLSEETKTDLYKDPAKTKAKRRGISPTNILGVTKEDEEFLKSKGIELVTLSNPEYFGIWESKIVYEPRRLRDLIIEIGNSFLTTEPGEFGATSVSLVGGKGAGLSELGDASEEIDVKTLPAFYTTSNAYDLFIEENGVTQEVDSLDSLTEEWINRGLQNELTSQEKEDMLQEIERNLRPIRKKIINGEVPEAVKQEIKQRYTKLCTMLGEKEIAVSVRSSGTSEDSELAAFPGQFESDLNVSGEEEIINKYKKIIASRFLPNAIVYAIELRTRYLREKVKQEGIEDIDRLMQKDSTLRFRGMKMAVGIVVLAPEPLAAGQAYSIDPATGRPGIRISAGYGYGVGVADNDINLDSWFLDSQGEKILERRKGPKLYKYVKSDDGGLSRIETTEEERNRYSLTDEQVLKIASSVARIKNYYRKRKGIKHIDTEFVIDKKFGQRILQTRAETRGAALAEKKVVFVKEKGQARFIYSGGIRGSEGASIGELQYAESVEEVRPDVILLTPSVTHTWTIVFPQIKGLITDTGDIGGHGAATSRDLGIPAIVGSEDASRVLRQYDGQTITLDANTQIVYLGEARLGEETIKTEMWLEKPSEIKNRFTQHDDVPEKELEQDWQDNIKTKQVKELDDIGDGTRYIGRPNYPISRLQREVYANAFKELAKLLDIELTQREEGGILYILFSDNIKIRHALRQKSIDELIEFDERRVADINEFVKLCSEFTVTPENIERFVELYTRVNMWMDIGWDLGVAASILRDEYLRFVHPAYHGAFLEVSKSKEITETNRRGAINIELVAQIKSDEALAGLFRERKPEEIAERLKEEYPDFYDRVYRHSEEFRFANSVLQTERPVIEVLEELKRQLSVPQAGPAQIDDQLQRQIESMLKEYPAMAKTLRLSRNEVDTKETIHHLKYRAQWAIADELLRFGEFLVNKGALNRSEGIFDLGIDELIDKVEKYHKEYAADEPTAEQRQSSSGADAESLRRSVFVTCENIEGIIDDESLVSEFRPAITRAANTINRWQVEHRLGYRVLPEMSEELLQNIESHAKSRVDSGVTDVVLIGMGGQYSTNRALHDSLRPSLYNSFGNLRKGRPRIHFLGNIDTEAISAYLRRNNLDPKTTDVCLSSKSGDTPETLANGYFFVNWLVDSLGEEEALKHVVVLTNDKEPIAGQLGRFFKDKEVERFYIPTRDEDVGGRFSILAPSSLITAAYAGIDIRKLLKGAYEMKRSFEDIKPDNINGQTIRDNTALLMALYVYYNLLKESRDIFVVSTFSEKLRSAADFFKQLFGESSGKDNKGIFPCIASGVETVNEFINSPQDKIFLFLNYLPEFVEPPRVMGHPYISVNISRLDEYTMGELAYLCEEFTVWFGALLGIDPLIQPKVQLAKDITEEELTQRPKAKLERKRGVGRIELQGGEDAIRAAGLNKSEIDKALADLDKIARTEGKARIPDGRGAISKNVEGWVEGNFRSVEGRLKRDLDDFVIVGDRQSLLKIRAIYQAVVSPLHEISPTERGILPRVHFIDETKGEMIGELFANLNPERTLVQFISELGIAAGKDPFMRRLKRRFEKYPDNILYQSEIKDEALKDRLSQYGLTPPEIFSSMMFGLKVDEILKFMAGYRNYPKRVARELAAYSYLLYREGAPEDKKTVNTLFVYSNRLAHFTSWVKFRYRNKFSNVRYGPAVDTAIGSTDQHSVLEPMLNWKNKIFTIFIKPEEFGEDFIVEDGTYATELVPPYMIGRSMKELLSAMHFGVSKALTNDKRPNVTISVPRLNPRNLGSLFAIFENASDFECELLSRDVIVREGPAPRRASSSGQLNANNIEKFVNLPTEEFVGEKLRNGLVELNQKRPVGHILDVRAESIPEMWEEVGQRLGSLRDIDDDEIILLKVSALDYYGNEMVQIVADRYGHLKQPRAIRGLGSILGFARFIYNRRITFNQSKNSIELEEIFLEEVLRGKGTGSEQYKLICDILKKAGFGGHPIRTKTDNFIIAREFYGTYEGDIDWSSKTQFLTGEWLDIFRSLGFESKTLSEEYKYERSIPPYTVEVAKKIIREAKLADIAKGAVPRDINDLGYIIYKFIEASKKKTRDRKGQLEYMVNLFKPIELIGIVPAEGVHFRQEEISPTPDEIEAYKIFQDTVRMLAADWYIPDFESLKEIGYLDVLLADFCDLLVSFPGTAATARIIDKLVELKYRPIVPYLFNLLYESQRISILYEGWLVIDSAVKGLDKLLERGSQEYAEFIRLLNDLKGNAWIQENPILSDIVNKALSKDTRASSSGADLKESELEIRRAMLEDDWKYLLNELREGLSRAKEDVTRLLDLLRVCNEVSMKQSSFPIESRYPILRAVALLSKDEQDKLVAILGQPQNTTLHHWVVVDSILLMLNESIPQDWLSLWASNLRGRSIWQVASEIWYPGGGLGRVMQYHSIAMNELLEKDGIRLRHIEPYYQFRRDKFGDLVPIEYSMLPIPLVGFELVERFPVKIGSRTTEAFCYRAQNPFGIENYLIRDGEWYASRMMYNYSTPDNPISWEEFSEFFSLASLELVRRIEGKERSKNPHWKPPVIHPNDAQVALFNLFKEVFYPDDSILRDAKVAFTTHTYLHRGIYDYGTGRDILLGWNIPEDRWRYFEHMGEGWNPILDVTSAGSRISDWAGGVSRKQIEDVAKYDQWAGVDLVAVTNGDLRVLTASRFREIMLGLFPDADLEHPTPSQVVETKREAKRRLGREIKERFALSENPINEDRPIVSYSGRLVPEKVGRKRAFTDENIEELVREDVQVVIYGNIQFGDDRSLGLARGLSELKDELEGKNYAGRLIFVDNFDIEDQRLLLAATDIQVQDSDEYTEAAGFTEADIAVCGGLELAPPWPEGILQTQGVKINLDVPGEGNTLIPEDEDGRPESYLKVLEKVLAKTPEELAEYQATSVRLSRVLEARLTAAEYLRQFNATVERKETGRASSSGKIKSSPEELERWYKMSRNLLLMTLLHNFNLELIPPIEKTKTMWHVIPVSLIPQSPQYNQRTKFIEFVNQMNRVYPAAREKIKVVTDRQDLAKVVAELASDANNIVDVALDDESYIDKIPDGIRMLVFKPENGEPGDFRQLEGILAALRALHIKDLYQKKEKLSRLYELLTGEPPKYIPDMSDPREFARQFIIILPPIRVENYEDLKMLNENLLHLIESA